jgi:hypothetical protein
MLFRSHVTNHPRLGYSRTGADRQTDSVTVHYSDSAVQKVGVWCVAIFWGASNIFNAESI